VSDGRRNLSGPHTILDGIAHVSCAPPPTDFFSTSHNETHMRETVSLTSLGSITNDSRVAGLTELHKHVDKGYSDERFTALQQALRQSDGLFCLGTASTPLPNEEDPFRPELRRGRETKQYCWVWFRSEVARTQLAKTLGEAAIIEADGWFRVKSTQLIRHP